MSIALQMQVNRLSEGLKELTGKIDGLLATQRSQERRLEEQKGQLEALQSLVANLAPGTGDKMNPLHIPPVPKAITDLLHHKEPTQ